MTDLKEAEEHFNEAYDRVRLARDVMARISEDSQEHADEHPYGPLVALLPGFENVLDDAMDELDRLWTALRKATQEAAT